MKFEATTDRFNKPYILLQLGDIENGPLLSISADFQVADADELLDLTTKIAGGPKQGWKRIQPIFQSQISSERNNFLSGVIPYRKNSLLISFAYPKNTNVLKALTAVEDLEGDILPVSLVITLVAADRSLRLVESKTLPLNFAYKVPTSVAESFIYHKRKNRKPPLPPPIPDDEIQQMIRHTPTHFFDGSVDIPGEVTLAVCLEAIFGKGTDARTTDFVNWLFAFGKYLWSQEWWTSSKVRLYARALNSTVVAGISSMAVLEAHFRKPQGEYRGLRFNLGVRDLETLVDPENNTQPLQAYVNSMLHLWPQLVELYSQDCPPEVFRFFIPNFVFSYAYLGVDLELDLEDEQILHAIASSLIEQANQDAVYAPFGTFSVSLPEEIVDRIKNTRRRSFLGIEEVPQLLEIDFDRLMVSADPEGLWVRLGGRKGWGGIVRWKPGHRIQDNMVSGSFAVLLNTILAALWRDLRVAGPESFILRQKDRPAQRSAKTRNETPADSQRQRGKRSARGLKPSRPVRYTRVLPSPLSPTRFELSRDVTWASEDERRIIRRRLHGVRGFPRRLPPNWKPSDAAIQLAKSMGVILPEGTTFVRPHVRGTREAVSEETVDPTPIKSNGLATLLAFLESRQND